ncbi:general secretion pathway protein GspD [Hydrogenophaga aromaticivorans]|uniref:secretin N-terminal domain-containing protein n=1 Tax=Hydrogenophaga aromaticivorans TaxID=2610898 RepID=UPI001B367330|nr:secretin N-terminal domain-containing protein [Hydrogenophaga aromaticivorans]MBQ0921759.1 general secretion pathway protein GspD [Hydrogenophaga aromaticivorans]
MKAPSRLTACWTCQILAIVVLLSGCAAQWEHYQGQRLTRAGQHAEAAQRFEQASQLEPDSARYRLATSNAKDAAADQEHTLVQQALERGQTEQARKALTSTPTTSRGASRSVDFLHALETQERHREWAAAAKAAMERKEWDKARTHVRQILIEDPSHPDALRIAQVLDRADADKRGGSRQSLSDAFRKPITIEFKDAPLKSVFEVISRSSGINFIFDRDIKLDQKTSIFLRNSTIDAAIRLTLLTNQLEQQVLDGNTVLIHPSTQAKVREYQPLKVRVFYLSNGEAKTVAATLKTILKTRDLVSDDKLNMLVMRDTPEAIALAEKLVAAHDVAEPEVMLEVEVLEVNRKRLLELGVRWPDQLSLTPLGANESGLTLADLWSVSRDRTGRTIGASVGSTSINARKVDSDGEILANPRIRVRNRQKAKILIGDRVPNITSTSSATGFVAESITYVDVGLKLDVEPTVYVDGEVAINVALEVSTIVDQIKTPAGSVAYRIGTRSAQTVLRLKDGENQVLAGLLSNEERSSANKVPGLGELPVAGRLFGSHLDDENKTEIVLSITPRILRNIQRPGASTLEFDSGTEASLGTSFPAGAITADGRAEPARGPALLPPAGAPGSGDAQREAPDSADPADRSADPETGATRMRWQGPSRLRKGDTVAIQLVLQSEQPVVSLPVSVAFDPKALQMLSVREGNLFKRSGDKSSFAHRVDPAGQVVLTSTTAAEGGVSGSGVVATFNLRVLNSSPPETALSVTTAAPVGLQSAALVLPPPPPMKLVVTP